MANAKYDEGRTAIAKGDLDLDTAVVDLVAVDDSYVFDPTHSSGDITGVLDTAASLTGQAVDAEGYFTTDTAVFTGLAIGEDPAGFILREQGGDLICFIDTLAGDLPVAGAIIGDGTNVELNPDPLGWFRN